MKIISINPVQDAQKVNRVINNTYDNLSAIYNTSRPGFTPKGKSEHAWSFWNTVGYMRRFFNSQTGEHERVTYFGTEIHRTVYDANKKPIENIIFTISKDRKHFNAVVTVPGDNGETMRLLPNGNREIYSSEKFELCNGYNDIIPESEKFNR